MDVNAPVGLTVDEHAQVTRLLVDAYGTPVPRQAFGDEQPCQLLGYHAPIPVMTEYHHTRPVFLQNRLYGKIIHGPDLWVCSNCHDAIHAELYWLLGMHRKPPRIGYAARDEATRTYAWYLGEQAVHSGN